MNNLKRFLLNGLLLLNFLNAIAQTGTIKGTVTDAKTNEFLIGTTVVIKGTTQGAITDFDGNYIIRNVEPGKYNLVISFISYDPQEFQIEVQANRETLISAALSPATLDIGEVQVVAKANRESESMLLIDQKNASEIKESIGSKRLSSLGVSNAAAATSKIAGVTQNESTGDIYIRGLGDRYLSTTMNGLPIPSDDVEKKNMDLNLFSTEVIKNVGISKTYSASNYGDQSSGVVDIASKTTIEKVSIGLSSKFNSNVLNDENWGNFAGTPNCKNVSFGFFSESYSTRDAVKNQSWNTLKKNFPLGRDFSILGGKKIQVFSNDFTIFGTLSQTNTAEFQTGVYKKYRSNVLDNSFTDADLFSTQINTSGLLNLAYDFNKNSSLNFNMLAVYKLNDILYEQGRNGEGYVFDQDPQENGAFVRDQNLKQTKIWINQLLGKHQLNSKNRLEWAAAYNFVKADEPNRIRNEVNILDQNMVQFAHVGDFQQRKSNQTINEAEINGYIKDEFEIINEENKKLKLDFGGNFRTKKRDFSSLFIGVRAKGVQVQSIDNLDEALLNNALYQSGELLLRERKPDTYNAGLTVFATYFNASFERNKLAATVGLRFEKDGIDVDWNVGNYVGRTGNISNAYHSFLPAVNVKYRASEKNNIRFAVSKTNTLPEFKELAPFEYVSPTGRVTKGNPDLKHSENYNIDLKWEMFPTSKELFSVATFYKQINNPINLAQTRGSSGNFIYENTGEKAHVYGLELETRLGLIHSESAEKPNVDVVLNATKMWFNQDLLKEFQYNNKIQTDLQGAAGFIANAALNFSTNKENLFSATLTGNYSSDKIFALGAPEDFENSDRLFNNEIIEKGFAALDVVLSKKIKKSIEIKLSGKNLLNPKIEQTQEIKPLSGEAFTAVVSSYKKGVNLSLGVKISLNK